MLRTLLESARPHSIPLGSLVASIAVHVALSIPAWKGTPAADMLAIPESFITRALFLPPPDRLSSRSAGAERLSWVTVGVPGSQPYFVPDAPRSSRLGGSLLDRLGAAPSRPADAESPLAASVAGNDTAYSILQVDEIVERYADSGAPLYPADLLQQAMEGLVRVRYIVEVTGRVDMSTVRVLRSSHPMFTAAVVEALARMRFRPATIAEKPVSQVVEQDFGFRIEPRAEDSAVQAERDTTRSGARLQ